MSALIALLAAMAAPPGSAAVRCTPELVSTAPGENQTMFHGLSPDGRELAVGWDRGSGKDIKRGAFILDLATGKRTELPHLNNAPSFSSDGRFLVAANYADDPALRTEIVELDRKTGQSRGFASAPSGEWLASYAPNGQSILLNSTRTGGSDIYRVDRTNGAVELVTSDPRYEAHASFIGDGRRIIFHRQTDGDNYDLVIRDLRTSAERLVGATPLEEAFPAISRDGRWIAFSAVSSAGEQPNLYIMRPDGTGKARLTNGTEKDAYATWSPDGNYIYFVRFGPENSRIYRVRMGDGRCLR